MSTTKTGWLPDKLDPGDYTLETDKINALIRQIQMIRGLDDFLGSLDGHLTQSSLPKSIFNSFNPKSLLMLLGGLRIDVQGVSLTLPEAIAHLREDLEVISRGLTSGIDLIAASPHPDPNDRARYLPLLPPIGTQVFNLFVDLGVIRNSKGIQQDTPVVKEFLEYNDPALVDARRILHRLAPLAKHGRGKDLEKAIQTFRQSSGEKLDLLPSHLETNTIRIDPQTMHNVLDQHRSSQATAATRQGPPTVRTRLAGEQPNPPLRIPLNGTLSRQLRQRLTQNYVLPDIVDLSYWCSPVKHQGDFNACTSHAVTSLVEYFQNRLSDRPNQAFQSATLSARFLYKVTRHLRAQDESENSTLKHLLRTALTPQGNNIDEQVAAFLRELNSLSLDFSGQRQRIKENIKEDYLNEFMSLMFDVGASIRQTFKALQLFGIPPERYWPYGVNNLFFNDEPPQFCYAFAQNYQKVRYFRLDAPKERLSDVHLVLKQIKAVLAAGFPAVCGFVYEPDSHDRTSGNIPFPSDDKIRAFKQFRSDRQAGNSSPSALMLGHAVLVVGYSDIKEAFLFQNSYGLDWGDAGYGWLPYRFVLEEIATDWWSLLNSEWVEVGDFGLDSTWGRRTPWGD